MGDGPVTMEVDAVTQSQEEDVSPQEEGVKDEDVSPQEEGVKDEDVSPQEEGVKVPLVHIHFYDSGHAQGIYQLIEAYMLSLRTDPLCDDLKQQVTAASRDVEARDGDDGDEMDTTPIATPSHELEFSGQVEYFVEYCLDRYPMTYKAQVVFDQVYAEPFWIDPFVAKEEKRLRRMAIKCFNCGEDHHINHCTEPKNFARIQAELRQYKESLGVIGSDKRYHLTAGSDRFSKFRPGEISARLRQALGIGPSSLPPYIPRMHLLGYPPGYRLQSEEQSLLLYHSPHTGNPPTSKSEQSLKVIIYPGFNDHEIVQHAEPPPPPSPPSPPPRPADPHAVPARERGGMDDSDHRKEGVVRGGARKSEENKAEAKKVPKGKTESKRNQLEDDLGTLNDYELEEVDGDDGEMVVGFCVRRPGADSPVHGGSKSKQFSLDFPPGLVDIEAAGEPSSEKWNALKRILKGSTEEVQN